MIIITDIRLTFKAGKNNSKIARYNKIAVFPDRNHVDSIPLNKEVPVNIKKMKSGVYLACLQSKKR